SQQLFSERKRMLDAVNCALSDERKVSRQQLLGFLLAGEIFGVASLCEEIDRSVTSKRQRSSRHPRVIHLWDHRLQTQRPKGLEFRIEIVRHKPRSQPQQAVNHRNKFSAAKIENKSDYGITVRQPSRTTEDQGLQCPRVLPRTIATKVDSSVSEAKLCV